MASTIADRFTHSSAQCKTLIELLRLRALTQPDRDAYIYLVDGETKEARLTYRTLHEQASAIGALLQSRGMTGERAMLLYQPGLEFISAFFGCLYAGAVAVPAYPPDTSRLNRSLPRFEGLLADAKAKMALTSRAILSVAEPLFEKLPVSKTLSRVATDDLDLGLAADWREPEVDQDDLAFLQYTSGSTGRPRGVMLSHRNLFHNASMVYRAMEHTDQDRYVSWLPVFHDMGFMAGVLQPLYAGIPAILLSPISFLQKPVRWLNAISKYRGTTSGGPNFAYDLCARKITPDEREMLDLSSWTVAFNGAEPVRAESLENFVRTFESCGFNRATFYPCYGLAEATLIVSGGKKSDPPVIVKAAPDDRPISGEPGTADKKAGVWVGCGRSLSDQKVVIVDPETLIECPTGAVGEIWVSGPSVAGGYWGRPEETAAMFGAFLPATGEGPFLRTGDLGFQREGELCIAGRIKDLIIIRGRNHYPQDIELTVEQCHPALRPGCGAAFAVDVDGEERVVIAHEIDERIPLDLTELIDRIRQTVSEVHELQTYAIVLVKVGSIFKTSSGKIQRHACRAAFEAGALEVVAANGALAKKVTRDAAIEELAERRRAFEERLKAEIAVALKLPASEIDVDKPLTRYGLDSLSAIEIECRFEQTVGVGLPLNRFLEGSSISQLLSAAMALTDKAAPQLQTALPPSAPAPEFYPLSEGQKGLWFLQGLRSDNTAYSITRAVRITTALDIDALQRAFQALIDRHRCLRTSFHEIDGEPLQRIQEQVDIPFRVEDASGWSDGDLMARLATEAARPFELDRAPLMRVTLLLRSAHDHILLLNIHHIVADLWSLAALIKELAALYQAEKNKTPLRLPHLTLEYTDYVRQQAEMLAGEEGERLWRYWQERLGGEIPVLNLPTDRPRASTGAERGGVVHFSLGRQLTDKLKRLSRELEITLYTTLLASFNLLLHRYTGQRDIAIGSPTVGRRSLQLADVIGYFVNPVVMRSDLSGNPTFRQLAQRMRPDVSSALGHSGYPLPLLVKKLRPGQGSDVSPLFQVMFSLQNINLADQDGLGPFALGVQGGKLQIGELSFTSMSIEHHAPQFDLTLMMCEDDGELKAYFEYDADLFDNQTIVRMAGHFRQLIDSICLDPDHRIGQMRYLPEAESRQLIDDWNRHPRESLVHPGMPELFQRQAALTPDVVALVSDDHALTYRELNARANQLAHHLRRRGAGPELPVAVCMGRTPEMIIALLGILKSGSPYLPLDPAYPVDRLRYMLDDTRAALIVSHREWADAYADDARLVRLDLDWPVISAEAETDPVFEQSPGQSAYLIYTSGSTGRPKGVVIEHRSFSAFLHWVREEFSDRELSCVLASTSICFDLSVFEIFGPLSWGGSLILIENALQLAEKREVAAAVQVINTVPSAIKELLRLDAVPDGGRTIALAGERLEPGLARDLYQQAQASRVLNLYGPSEDTTYSTLSRVPSCNDPDVTIGRGITGAQVYLLDSEMEIVGIGICGEIYLGGAGLARGYWDRPEITAERFLPNPFAAAGGRRLYRTGDLGRVRPDGEIEFLGRADQQVKIRGYRIELGEIESVILSYPGVTAAAVIARENGSVAAQLVAYVEEHEGSEISGAQIKQHVATRLPNYMAPQAVIKMSQLPRTPNGKLDRRRLPSPGKSDAPAIDYEQAPRQGVEEILAEIWREVLSVERVGANANFFELGGHSLLAARMIARVKKTFGIEAELRAVFECRSLAEMSERIATRLRGGRRIETPSIEPSDRNGLLPLSDAQRRLWFLDQMNVASGLYNMSGVLRFRGGLNLQALEQSLNRIVERHESLRTTFPMINGTPVQRIAERLELSLSPLDLQSDPNPEGAAEKAALEDAQQPFDLLHGPLLRCRLLRIAVNHHQLLVTMHHIISDGWSVDLFIRELIVLYQSLTRGVSAQLPELPIRYADYALWQAEGSDEDRLEPALTYWRNRLAGDLPELVLPTDRPRPTVSTYQGESLSVSVAKAEAQAIKALGHRHQASLYMTLLTGFKALLHRYSGQDDFAVGTPVANRNRVELEGVIGCFVNTLVLRTNLSGDPTFSELLARVRETALGAYAYQDLPFERLVEELSPERNLSRSPLFQTLFDLQPQSTRHWTLGGIEESLELELIEIENGTAKFDLTLTAREEANGLKLRFEYSANLFDRWRVEQMARHYLRLLRAVTDDPDLRIGRIDLLEEAERRQILVEWNATEAAYPHQQCLHELFEAQADTSPTAIAVVDGERRLTYSQLNSRANQLAHHLRDLGVGPDARVAICMERCAEMVIGVLGILKAGGAYVPIDPTCPQERVAFTLIDSQASVLLTQKNLAADLPFKDLHIVSLDTDWADFAEYEVENPFNTTGPDNLAYVIYTSGSTGIPKGVMTRHCSVVNLVTALYQAIYQNYEAPLRVGMNAPLFFDGSVKQLVQLLCGHSLYIVPEELRVDAAELLSYIRQHAIEALDFTPSQLRLMLEAGLGEERALKLALVGGESIDKALWAELAENSSVAYFNVYGPTECTVDTSICRALPDSSCPTIGRPIANAETYLLDTHMRPVPIGVAGELYIGGDGLARGYLNSADLTAERFLPNPYSGEAGARLYRSGDQARYLPGGRIEFIGRLDNQVKLRGYRIELGEIEAQLTEYPGVKQVVVMAPDDRSGARKLVAYYTGKETGAEALRSHLSSKLPHYMAPAAYIHLEALPLTENGKLDRKALPAVGDDAYARREYEAPVGKTESQLAQIWTDLLKVEKVGRHDNFFDLGGHSLLATQVISRLREEFGVEIAVRQMFETPSIADLGHVIDGKMACRIQIEVEPILQIDRNQPLELSFAQQRLWFLWQMEPGSAAYNICAVVKLEGELNEAALRESFEAVMKRHESLRTRFVNEGGKPRQVIDESAELWMRCEEAEGESEREREEWLMRRAAEEGGCGFNLENGPLLRVLLLRESESRHALVVNMHHIISDGWSMGVLIRELVGVYEARIGGGEAGLRELEAQYADYAAWQRRRMSGERLAGELSYWKQQLTGAPGALELPTDRVRPAVLSGRGGAVRLSVDREASERLREEGRRQGVTAYMQALGGVALLLKRYSGQVDVVVGSPIAGRTRREFEGLIGFFVNTLVMRMEVREDERVDELMRRAREVALGAYAHQEAPFEKVVEEMEPERDLSRQPLFQVMMSVNSGIDLVEEMGGVKIHRMEAERRSSKFDLAISLTEDQEGRIVGEIEYSEDLYEQETIERMSRHLERLLEEISVGSDRRARELELLSAGEKRQLLCVWNDTARDYERETLLHELISRQAGQTPDRTAVIYKEQHLGYDELERRSNQLARYLRSRGVKLESRVGVCLERRAEMVVALLAILKAGAAYVPLDAAYPERRLHEMVEDAELALLITGNGNEDRLGGYLIETLNLDEKWDEIGWQSPQAPHVDVQAENLAYIIYTSGSTGKPKGVMVEHRSVVNFLQSMAERPGMKANERLLAVTTLSFDIAGLELFLPLMVGGQIVLMSREQASDGEQLVRQLKLSGAGVMQATPASWRMMLSAGLEESPGLKALCGGEALSQELSEELTKRAGSVWNMYGPTETTIWSGARPIRGDEASIGGAIANTQFYVVDERQEPAAVGVVGELLIGGAGLSRGYWRKAEETSERYLPDGLSGEPGRRLYRTGDLVRWRGEGELEYLGRSDQQVKVRGYRIELKEIERRLMEAEGVKQAAVAAREDGAGDKRLVAYIVPDSDYSPDFDFRNEQLPSWQNVWNDTYNPLKSMAMRNLAQRLRGHLRERLPEHMIPSVIVSLEQMPLTPNGKLDRKALPAPEFRAQEQGYLAPRTVTELRLASIWSQVLGLDKVGVGDNFFELGGHSLQATQVISRLRQSLGVEVQVADLFARPVLADLALIVDRASLAELPPILPIDRSAGANPLELSFSQQRLWFLSQFEGASEAYNIAGGLRLLGSLDRAALRRALNRIIARHEVLRTTFSEVDGRPVQNIGLAETGFLLREHDLRLAPDRSAALERLAADEARQPFDLEHGPLIRGVLAQLDQDDHALLVTMHHIVSDGWSLGILINELNALYRAYREGGEAALPDLPIQYADYAAWQKEWLRDGVLEAQLSYWTRHLKGAPPLLDLPTDHPRPQRQSFKGAREPVTIPQDVCQSLEALSRREGVTLFMTLLAAWQTLLRHYSGQEDIVVCTPTANRNLAEIEGLIGYFANTLALRTDLSGDPTFRELISRVREVTLNAYRHQDLPFEKLIEELQPERSLSHHSVAQVVFVLQNAPKHQMGLTELDLTPLDIAHTTSKFDLVFNLSETDRGLLGSLEYSTDLFEALTIRRMLTHFVNLLRSVAAQPDNRLSALEFLSEEEKITLEQPVDFEAFRESFSF